MGVNKVVYGGNTLIDLSADTVAANKMLAGITGHDKAGNPITGNIPSQAAQTITPGTADKTIAAGKYLSGKQTIKGDANLKAVNIAKGVSIFGVTGTHEGGEDVSAETAEYTELLTDLETAIDALPDAGSGGGSGSVETCTVEVRSTAFPAEVCYVDAETQAAVWWLAEEPGAYPQPFKVQNKSIVYVSGGRDITVSGGNLLRSDVYFVSPGAGGTCIIE